MRLPSWWDRVDRELKILRFIKIHPAQPTLQHKKSRHKSIRTKDR